MGYKLQMESKANKDELVTLDFQDLMVTEETKVTWERDASRVTWNRQVQKERLGEGETWDKKVNQVTKVQREINGEKGLIGNQGYPGYKGEKGRVARSTCVGPKRGTRT